MKKIVAVRTGNNYGVLGTPTLYRDDRGIPLFVGDIVHIQSKECPFIQDNVLVVDGMIDGSRKQFIDSIERDCDGHGNILDEDWAITKVMSFEDVAKKVRYSANGKEVVDVD